MSAQWMDGDEIPASVPSAAEMIAARQREGFFEEAYGRMEGRCAAIWKDLNDAKDALERERARNESLMEELASWRVLAFKYGLRTDAERRADRCLYGRLAISEDLLRAAKADVIDYACVDLAKKLRAESAAARATPAGGTEP